MGHASCLLARFVGMANLTGPEHFTRAEELLREAADRAKKRTEGERTRMLAEAQVHATLALVAATVHSGATSEKNMERWNTKGVWMH